MQGTEGAKQERGLFPSFFPSEEGKLLVRSLSADLPSYLLASCWDLIAWLPLAPKETGKMSTWFFQALWEERQSLGVAAVQPTNSGCHAAMVVKRNFGISFLIIKIIFANSRKIEKYRKLPITTWPKEIHWHFGVWGHQIFFLLGTWSQVETEERGSNPGLEGLVDLWVKVKGSSSTLTFFFSGT